MQTARCKDIPIMIFGIFTTTFIWNDMELTWHDVMQIVEISDDVISRWRVEKKSFDKESYYTQVLNEFNEKRK